MRICDTTVSVRGVGEGRKKSNKSFSSCFFTIGRIGNVKKANKIVKDGY